MSTINTSSVHLSPTKRPTTVSPLRTSPTPCSLGFSTLVDSRALPPAKILNCSAKEVTLVVGGNLYTSLRAYIYGGGGADSIA